MIDSEARPHPPEAAAANLTIEQLKEKKEPNLGELNPLLFPPNLDNAENVEALRMVTEKMVSAYEGLKPTSIEVANIFDDDEGKEVQRLVIRFETDSITPDQMNELEEAVEKTYKKGVKTRTSISGKTTIPATFYPRLEQPKNRFKRQNSDPSMLGWYMGTDTSLLTASNEGLLVFRDLENEKMAGYLKKTDHKRWFYKQDLITPMKKKVPPKYVVEVRESELYQTDIVELVTRVSHILADKGPIENKRLKYDIYNQLNRLGLKKVEDGDMSGLDLQEERIQRVLILPLANLDASAGLELKPGSVLMIGVPGTGKTYIAEHFIQQDNGVFLVPIDPHNLSNDLALPPEKKKILPRISEVSQETGVPAVIHIDDVENLATEDTAVNSTLLNLMAGIRESGFYVLASTNYPEKISPALIQPQRFAHIVYFGLHQEETRHKILDTHATRVTKELGTELFESDNARDLILKTLASITEGYTPRYLADICTEAKSFYLARTARETKQTQGLKEVDLKGHFTIEDWENAVNEVARKYDKTAVEKRDKELREFAKKHYKTTGLNHRDQLQGEIRLSSMIQERTAALRES